MRTLIALLAFSMLLANQPIAAATPLRIWPDAARTTLEDGLAHSGPKDFAVFDADGTLWSSDIEESGIAYFEERGWLSPHKLPRELKPIPLHRGETLYGYYRRLCDFDDKLCLPWSAQVFSSQPLSKLKSRVDALFNDRNPIPVRFVKDGRETRGNIFGPRPYPAQLELIRALQSKGVRVFVVTASNEELTRMIVSDPRYGFNIPPAQVIGTSTLLIAPGGQPSVAQKDIATGAATRPGYWSSRGALVPGTTLWSPLPWQEGKVASIMAYIDPTRRPLLVAGDTSSDWPMLFFCERAACLGRPRC